MGSVQSLTPTGQTGRAQGSSIQRAALEGYLHKNKDLLPNSRDFSSWVYIDSILRSPSQLSLAESEPCALVVGIPASPLRL